MSTDTTVYIGPYIEITSTKAGVQDFADKFGDCELFDCTDFITASRKGVRVLIPNSDRGAPRQFWLNPNDFCGFEMFKNPDQIVEECTYLHEKFGPEIEKLRAFYTEPDEGWIRWGYFVYEM